MNKKKSIHKQIIKTMGHKISDRKLQRILNGFYTVPRPVLVLIWIILFVLEFILNNNVYIILFDIGALVGGTIALGMSGLFTNLTKVVAKLLVKEKYGLAIIGIICASGFISFIFIGYEEVVRQEANDPMNIIMGIEADTESESNLHIIVTSLVSLLFVIGTFLSYLYYSDESKCKPLTLKLDMSKLARAFQYKLLIVRGYFERANAKPTISAESKVKDQIDALEKEVRELQLELDRQQARFNYDLNQHNNRRKRIKAAIETAYKI